MRTALPTLIAALTMLTLAGTALAQARPASDAPVVPEVDRREVRKPSFPSRDFEIGAFAGTYATQNFGASAVVGLKLGYHLTEDFFAQATIATAKVSDDDFRQILPGGVFADETEKLTYYNLSVGYNLLPGEVFLGAKRARPSQFYLIGGIGSTRFVDQRKQTFNVGVGWRVFVADWGALQVDLRDHVFSLDLLGKRESTQNLELTAGFSFFF